MDKQHGLTTFSTGNYIQYPVTNKNGKGYEKECVVVQSPSRVQLCDLMDCSMPGLSVPHHLLKLAEVHDRCIGDDIQPSHPPTSSSLSALNLSQQQELFQ